MDVVDAESIVASAYLVGIAGAWVVTRVLVRAVPVVGLTAPTLQGQAVQYRYNAEGGCSHN